MARLEKVMPNFYKRALCLPSSTMNRLIYHLVGEPPMIETLMKRHNLGVTDEYLAFKREHVNKSAAVRPEFFLSPGMVTTKWKEPLQQCRHLVTRYSVHGFHHKLCTRPDFHEQDKDCICKRCNEACGPYQFDVCPLRTPQSELSTF